MPETTGPAPARGDVPTKSAVVRDTELAVEVSYEDQQFDATLSRFQRLVDRDLDIWLTDKRIQRQLDRVQAKLRRWTDDPGWQSTANDLTGYAYGFVSLWVRLTAEPEDSAAELPGSHFHEFTARVVAQAMNDFTDDPPPIEELLARCLSKLETAYRKSWTDLYEIDGFETHASERPIRTGLFQRVTAGRERVTELMRSWGYSRSECAEFLDVTQSVIASGNSDEGAPS